MNHGGRDRHHDRVVRGDHDGAVVGQGRQGIEHQGPETTEWGWRQVSVKDPDGIRLLFYEQGAGSN